MSSPVSAVEPDAPILLRKVSKSFPRKAETGFARGPPGRREILKDISLDVKKGEIVCILGMNGSGKTTLTRILSTLVLPDYGDAWICGYSVVKDGKEVRRRIGVVLNAGDTGFQSRLSGSSNLEFYAALYEIPVRKAGALIAKMLSELGLEDRGTDQYQSYSTGMRRRLGLARALLSDPPVLLLDEPTLGVDPWSTREIHKILRRLVDRGKTILCTTNSLSEARALADRLFTLKESSLRPSMLEEVEAS